MKKILLDSSKPFFKANLHCHSTLSDGIMSPEQLKSVYKANGYAVLAITDHEHIIDFSYLNDPDFLTITSTELAVKEIAHMSTNDKHDMKVCHLNLYARRPGMIDTPCYSSVYDHYVNDLNRHLIVHTEGEYEREYSHEGISEIIRIANEKGFLVSYNHPGWSLENARDYLGYKGIWAVEIYNWDSAVTGRHEYYINAYDDFLRDGQRIACTANDDNHSERDICGGWNMINADALDYGAVIEAMEQHRLYASTGPVIHELYVEGDTAYLAFSKGAYATMSTKGRRVEQRMATVPDGISYVSFRILRDKDVYIRFNVVDAQGRWANTCAYFIDEL